jgi:ABC-type cobalt transport system substrate-binding protein
MAKHVDPDSFASKAFSLTMLIAALYITVVFIFIVGGNRQEEAAGKDSNGQLVSEIAPEQDWGEPHYD